MQSHKSLSTLLISRSENINVIKKRNRFIPAVLKAVPLSEGRVLVHLSCRQQRSEVLEALTETKETCISILFQHKVLVGRNIGTTKRERKHYAAGAEIHTIMVDSGQSTVFLHHFLVHLL